MLDNKTYRRELVRMWDSLRDDNKGRNGCSGVECKKCPLHGLEYGCDDSFSVVETYNIVEKWSKEHPKRYITQFEYEFLNFLENKGYKYIARSNTNNLLLALKSMPKGHHDDSWEFQRERILFHPLFKDLYKFVKLKDEKPTSIQDVLNNCEVKEDD